MEKTRIISNGTEQGNDRTPINDETKTIQGPVLMYFGEEDLGGGNADDER